MPDRSFYNSLGRLSAIIMILPSSMAAGWLFGYFLIDRYMSTFPWGTLLFVFLGAGAGFYEIVRIVLLDRDEKPGQ